MTHADTSWCVRFADVSIVSMLALEGVEEDGGVCACVREVNMTRPPLVFLP